jgi:excisionase family DNA binding protein
LSVHAAGDVAPVDRLMVGAEVASLLNVPESWVREAGLDGRLPSLKCGFYRRYRRQDILDWLERQGATEGRR